MMEKFLLLLSIAALAQANAAEWIRPERVKLNATFVVAKEFACTKQIAKATLKTSAAGIGAWKINGAKVGDGFYEPEVSYYQKRIYFRERDVTKLLRENNRIEAEVGGGWYDQNVAWACERWQGLNCSYGRPAAWAELELEFTDGTSEKIGTDASWSSGEGSSVWNNIYGGEIIDARGGSAADGKVVIAKDVVGELESSFIPPCRVLKTYPAKVRGAMGGRNDVWIFDFGTNIAGSVRFKLPPLVPGSRLKVRLAETLTKEGELDPRSLGSFANHCAPEYVYIAPDKPEATEFVPEFSYTSFRYAELSGFEPFPDVAKNWGKTPPEDLLSGVMIATDVKRIRKVEVESRSRTADGVDDSDAKRIERFVEIADHTIRCNLHGIPEDCPGREKGGWLGDATAVCPYALAVWDLEPLYVKFVRDIADGTEIFGEIPCQVPTHRAFAWGPAPALWRCAAIGIPYQLYKQRGNEKVVRENWRLIEKCLDMFAKDAEKDGLVRWGYGDWIPPAGKAYKMPVEHSSNLVWIECLEQADYLAKRLNIKTKRDYAAEAKHVREQFRNEFFDEKNGTFGYDGTDAVAFNLGIADTIPALLKRLAERDYMMTTGIYATPHLVRALKKVGRLDVMMNVLFNERHSSYRTVIDEGFTTCPEDLADKLRVSREDEPQHSLSHPMHCGWLAVLIEQ